MKIDTSLIEGFEEMSAEEQLEALKSYEFEDVEALKKDKANYKKRIDELTAELSKKKKEGSKNLSEAEQALEDLKAEKAELQEKYDELVKASSIASNKSKYLKLGFDEALAEDTATALADGDMEKVFANLEKHQASFEKKLKADEAAKRLGVSRSLFYEWTSETKENSRKNPEKYTFTDGNYISRKAEDNRPN